MLSFLFSPYGRMSRKTYWLYWILPYIAISIFVTILDYALFPIDPIKEEPPPVFQTLTGLILFWPSLATSTKRLHDRGMTGWWNIAPAVVAMPLAAAAYWYYTMKMAAGGVPPTTDSPFIPALIVILSVVALGVVLYLLVNTLFLRGQSGDNKYGPDPLGTNQAEVFA